MRQTLFIFIFLFCSFSVFSQLFIPNNMNSRVKFDLNTTGLVTSYKDPTTFIKSKAYWLELSPTLSFFPLKNLAVGVQFAYSYANTNDTTFAYMFDNNYSYGLEVMYYLPTLNFKNLNDNSYFASIGATLLKSNLLIKQFDLRVPDFYTISKKPEYTVLHINYFCFSYRIWQNLIATLNCYYRCYLGIDGDAFHTARLGLSWYFNKKIDAQNF